MKKLVLCDFDGTLFKKDSFILFIKFYKGSFKLLLSYFILSPLIFLFYLKLYNAENLKRNLFNFHFKKLTKNKLESIGADFCNKILLNKNLQNELLIKKLEELKTAGAEICIVSASLDVWIMPFAKYYNYNFLCTELKYTNAIYEGFFFTKNCNGIEKKVRIMRHYNLKLFDDIIAFGDSKGDLEMFELAGYLKKYNYTLFLL